jgi:hypothetical protein
MAVRFVTGVLQEVATAIAVLLACRRHCTTIQSRHSAFLALDCWADNHLPARLRYRGVDLFCAYENN